MRQLLLVVTILTASTVANANPCFVITPDLPEAYNQAKAVFIGEVVKITKPNETPTDSTMKELAHKVTFKVEYSWKGAGFQDVGILDLVVLSYQGQAICETWRGFVEGRKYLVYAELTPEKDLIVGPGSRTMNLDLAAEDLKKLRSHGFHFGRATPSFLEKFDPFKGPVVRTY